MQDLQSFIYNLFFFIAKIKNSTNAEPIEIIIYGVGFIVSILLALYIMNKNEHLYVIAYIFLIMSCIIGFLAMTPKTGYPNNIDVTYEPGQYQEVKPEDYKAEKTQDNSRLSSRKVITYKAVIKYGTVEKEVLVNKIDRTYEKDSKLSEYSDKYHKKTLVKVRIRPVKVTTSWHGVKEHYDLYQVEEQYKVEPDLKKFNDEKSLNKLLGDK
mgnify:CR=1 FL=1